jgi:pimeloyl-ACP methyl ester carboxylesterase
MESSMKSLAALAVLIAVVSLALVSTPSYVTAGGLNPTPCAAPPATKDEANFTARAGAKAFFGDYEGGMYRFELPDNWNGELALFMHGTNFATNMSFGGGTGAPFAGTTGLREYMIDNGFAWGASTYRCNGYIPGIGLSDTILLKDLFAKQTSKTPTRVYLLGRSMGGFQTLLAMHVYPEMFDGALAMCAINSATWDFQVAAGAAAEYITGLRFTTPATVAETQARMAAITGLPGDVRPPGASPLTQRGLQLASIQIHLSGGPRPFAMEGLAAPFTGVPAFRFNMSGGTLAGATTPSAKTRANDKTKYTIDPGLGVTSADIDANVRRVSPDTSLYEAFEETRPLSGEIKRPLLTLHTTGDLVVPISSAQALQRAVDGAKQGNLLVQRFIRSAGHCTFTGQEESQAFADLVKWVRVGERPDGDTVLGDLSNTGLKFTNPLRPGDPGAIRQPSSPQAN